MIYTAQRKTLIPVTAGSTANAALTGTVSRNTTLPQESLHHLTVNGDCRTENKEAIAREDFMASPGGAVTLAVGENWYPGALHPTDTPVSLGYLFGKRMIDIIGSLAGLILLSPLFLLLFVLVQCDSAGKAIYRRRVLARQEYTGGTPQTFDAFKFRTMITDAEGFLEKHPELMAEYQKEFKLLHDPRITRVGAPLRRWSLDELPQLWNVLKGQMTLVGPRMITPPELANYGADAARLLSVKPGLTGLWQVSGRTNLCYSERVRLDMYYIENRSLKLDIEILIRTIGCVLGRRGAI